jgi:hypothetical protein
LLNASLLNRSVWGLVVSAAKLLHSIFDYLAANVHSEPFAGLEKKGKLSTPAHHAAEGLDTLTYDL